MLLLAIGGRADVSQNDVAGTYETLDTAQATPAWSTPTESGFSSFYAPAVTWYQTATTGRILTFSSNWTNSYTGVGGWQVPSPPLMPTPRDASGAAVAKDGRVYVIGGSSTPKFAFGTVEAYDPSTNKWTSGLSPMPTPRGFLAAALGTNGLLYAIGGRAEDGTFLGTVEAYDPSTDRWSTLSEIPDPASEPAAVGAPDGRVYVIGGNSGGNLLATVNAFSPATNRWSAVAPVDSARYGIGAVVAPDGRIWAVGGGTNPEFDGFTTVQIYGPVASVSPAAGAPGTTARVSGSNFAANATVSVYIGAATGTPLGTGSTNASGAITAPIPFNVPNLGSGQQSLIVVDDRSQYPVTLSFRVQ
jgi:hypothetical protein